MLKWFLNLLKCLIYHIIKDKKVCLRRVWIRLTTAYLLCAREFRQNNVLTLQFWCLSNALTLRVRALNALKSQRACIILSLAKVNTQLLIYNSLTASLTCSNKISKKLKHILLFFPGFSYTAPRKKISNMASARNAHGVRTASWKPSF